MFRLSGGTLHLPGCTQRPLVSMLLPWPRLKFFDGLTLFVISQATRSRATVLAEPAPVGGKAFGIKGVLRKHFK
jgi:hypothetical protein